MCAGAAYWTQIGKIVYGAPDEKRGFSNANSKVLHPSTKLQKGLLAEESARLIREFFEKKRKL
jgi:tRNA(adenine34) deaminase